MSWLAWILDLFRPRPRPTPVPPPKPVPPPLPLPEPPPIHPSTYVALLNAARARNGQPGLADSIEATRAATVQVQWQARRDRIGHDGPPGLPDVADRLAAQGIQNVACGEIAAEGQTVYWPAGTRNEKGEDIGGTVTIAYTFVTAVSDWLQSPGHRAILLGRQWRHVGAAMATASSGRQYATAVFY